MSKNTPELEKDLWVCIVYLDVVILQSWLTISGKLQRSREIESEKRDCVSRWDWLN